MGEKGRFQAHKIGENQASFKLGKVTRQQLGPKGIPYISTHDGRTIRYPDPDVKVNDTIKFDINQKKIIDRISFSTGNLAMVTGGRNLGRVGIITHFERHPGSFDIVHLRDARGQNFVTRSGNVFTIGKGSVSLVSLPRRKGIKLSIIEERDRREKKQE